MSAILNESETKEKILQKRDVEIERKFIIPDDCEERLLKIGCHFNKQEEFTDHYYDTNNYQLTVKDYWLRKRSGKWQMKYAVPEQPHDHASRYFETETESEILSVLFRLTSRIADSVQDFVRINCQPIAIFRTLRKSYSYSGSVNIVLDNTDFGFRIGEIEVIVKEGESFAEGLNAVDDLASKLGARHTEEGKIDYYLKTKQPHLYHLIRSHAVRKPAVNEQASSRGIQI